MTLNKHISKVIDIGSLLVALAVDLILNIVCMILLAPDPWIAVGFICIAIVIVLFSLRAWLKGKWQRGLWAIFAIVAFFFDTSLALEGTRAQTASAIVQDDPELNRLTTLITTKNASLVDLQRQYDAANNRTTLDQIDAQIIEAHKDLREAESQRATRFERLDTKSTHAQIKADDVFEAIPRAITDKRIIQLVIFSLIFGGLQLTIIAAAGKSIEVTEDAPARRKYGPRTPISELITKWVSSNWVNGQTLISQKSFYEFWKHRDGFPASAYAKIKNAALDIGIIGAQDEIRTTDQAEATRILIDRLG